MSNVFKLGLQLMFVNPSQGIQHVCPRYVFQIITVYAQIYIKSMLQSFELSKQGFVCFWFISWLLFFKFLKYAFKTSTFCIVVLGYSAVICSIWFLRLIICLCKCMFGKLANLVLPVLQVIVLVFVFVVNLIIFGIFLCGYNILVDQKS